MSMRTKDPQLVPEFGKNIQQLRKDKKLKQSELAEEIGLSRELISYYESRCQNPTTEIVKKFAEYFSVDVSELISTSSEEKVRKGPKSKLEKQLELIRSLPQKEQKAISTVLDMALKNVSDS